MCGLTFSNGIKFYSEKKIRKSLDFMKHRGPDGSSMLLFKKDQIIMGQTRLAINDPSTKGMQPMNLGKIYLICNGEIYNYKYLKRKFFSNNKFKSKSDSEIIIHAYKKWGIKFLNYIEGMFSLVIWDKNKNKVIAARDSLGIKPLYYIKDSLQLVISSEINGLIPYINKFELNKKSLNKLFHHNFISSPDSIISEIMKLEPGHMIILDKKKFTKIKYHNFKFKNINPDKFNRKYFLNILSNVVNENATLSDRKVGLFLSSGLDSLGIFELMKSKVKTLSINNIDKEADKLNRILKNNKIDYKINLNKKIDITKIIKKISKTIDEPLFSMNLFFTYFLCSEASKKKIKVAISGSGGDELFNSYEWHKIKLSSYSNFTINILEKLIKLLRFLNIKSNNLKSITNKNLYINNYIDRVYSNFNHQKLNNILKVNYSKKILQKSFKFCDEIYQNLISNDIYNYCGNQHAQILDKIGMLHGIEIRVPFFDRRLFEYKLKFNNKLITDKKLILKDLLKQSRKINFIESRKIGGRFNLNPNVETLNLWRKELIKNKSMLDEYFNMDYIIKLDIKKNYKLYYFMYFFLSWYTEMYKKYKSVN